MYTRRSHRCLGSAGESLPALRQENAIPLAIGRSDGVLSVLPHSREDRWDRGAIVRGFWVLPGFRVRRVEWEADGARARLRDPDRAARHPRLRMFRLWTTDVARARSTRSARGTICRGPRTP